MDASRAATGMSDVLAISTVRFIRRFAGARVVQLRELHQNVGHFVAALAAAYVYDNVRVRPLCKLMLHHGLAAAERAGHCRHAAARDREERVDYALAGYHGLDRAQSFLYRDGRGAQASAEAWSD